MSGRLGLITHFQHQSRTVLCPSLLDCAGIKEWWQQGSQRWLVVMVERVVLLLPLPLPMVVATFGLYVVVMTQHSSRVSPVG